MTSALTILITGANQGLGFEAARHLSKHANIHLLISGRDPVRLSEAVKKLKADEGCRAVLGEVVMDVSDDESIKKGVESVAGILDGKALDVLVNNAGVASEAAIPTLGLRAVLQQTFAVNAFGAACTTDAFLPLLKKAAAPRVVNVSSTTGSLGVTSRPEYTYPTLMAYGSSKSALNAFTVALARQHPDIHAVCICPGYNATNLNSYAGTMDPKDGARIIADYALTKKGASPGFYNATGEVAW